MLDSLRGASLLSVDTETVSIKDPTLVGIGIQWSPNEALYIDVVEWHPYIAEIMAILGDRTRTKIYFNAMFDLRSLYQFALDEGYDYPDDINIEDASLAAQIQGNADHALDTLSIKYINYRNEYSIKGLLEEAGRRSTTLDIPIDKLGAKCINDCYATWHLWEYIRKQWPNPENEECYRVDKKLYHLLLSMERKGVALSESKLEKFRGDLQQKVDELVTYCDEYGFHPGKPQQVGLILSQRGCSLPLTEKGGQLKTDEDILENLDDPLADIVLQFRSSNKLLGTYITPWIGQSRAYTHYRIDLSTGRLASFDRNFQNIPPDIRAIFSADKSIFSWMDYSQIELRTLAYVARDATMIRAYEEGRDLHQMTADAAKTTRSNGKTFNFAKVFGASDTRLSKSTGTPIDKVREINKAWAQLYPEANHWINKSMNQHNGRYAVSDFGRRMGFSSPYPGANQRAHYAHISKCAVNYPIQGTAADIIKRAMLQLGDTDLRIQVHDELVVDGDFDFPWELEHIHPELHTPFEKKKDFIWK